MNSQDIRNLQEAYLEVVENHQLDEGMDMKDFKAHRRNIERKEASDDARKRGHVGKTWVDGGRTYSPDEAKSRRAKMTDGKRQALYRIANDPDDDSPDDDHYPASKTTNPKKLRKQRAMGEIGESYDLYDVILEYLLDEGYADTQESALAIMGNMSEDWRESIAENVTSGKRRVRNVQPKPTGPISNSERQSITQSRIDAETIEIKKAGDAAHAAATSKGLGFSDAQARRTAAELRLKREIAKSYP